MKKSIACLLVAIAACGHPADSGGGKRGGGINLGAQSAAITLAAGLNNNLAIPGGSPTGLIKLVAAGSGSTLSGINSAYFTDGDTFFVRNDGTGPLTITNADSNSSVANQFTILGGVAQVVVPHGVVQVTFDATSGLVLVDSASTIAAGNETITSGNMSLQFLTSFTSTTGTIAYTLPNGTFTGEQHCFQEITAASTPVGTVTITTTFNSEPTTHVITAVNQSMCFVWMSSGGWHAISKNRAGQLAVVVGTTVLTGFDLQATYELSVTGTVTSTGTKAIPNGLVAGEVIHVSTPTAASTPSGTINVAGTTIATGVAATALSGINATTVQADFRWDGATWQNTSLTTATYSTLEQMFLNLSSQVASNDNGTSNVAMDAA